MIDPSPVQSSSSKRQFSGILIATKILAPIGLFIALTLAAPGQLDTSQSLGMGMLVGLCCALYGIVHGPMAIARLLGPRTAYSIAILGVVLWIGLAIWDARDGGGLLAFVIPAARNLGAQPQFLLLAAANFALSSIGFGAFLSLFYQFAGRLPLLSEGSSR